MFKKSDDANGESLGRKMCKFRQTQFITRVGYGRVKCLIKMFALLHMASAASGGRGKGARWHGR